MNEMILSESRISKQLYLLCGIIFGLPLILTIILWIPLQLSYDGVLAAFFIVGVILSFIIAAVILVGFKSVQLTITDKRVYGTTTFNRRVDLPMDSISAVATIASQGIAITTASGAIKFSFIDNVDEMYRTINDLLILRQNNNIVHNTSNSAPPASSVPSTTSNAVISGADEIVKYKNLLDQGILTQEEFEAKKKQILGI